jgi:acyl-CoA thioester hydrolase
MTAAPIEVYRNSVQTWEADQMGHMNVQFYVDKSASALAVLSHHLDLGPAYARSENARLIPREHHIRFLREQRPGAPLQMVAGILDAGPDRLRVYQEMTNAANGEVAATFSTEVQLVDLASREARPLPPAALDAAARLQMELPAHAAPRGLDMQTPRPSPKLAEADALGMLPTYHGQVTPAMCDADGWLATRSYMGIVSDAVPNLMAQVHGADRSQSSVGGAALEYRFVYRKSLRAGDLITLRSGIRQLAPKTYTFVHWMFDLSTGEAIATAEVVAIMLDLKARKAIEIPEQVKTVLERVLIPEASI